jgi:hypothetical protein
MMTTTKTSKTVQAKVLKIIAQLMTEAAKALEQGQEIKAEELRLRAAAIQTAAGIW